MTTELRWAPRVPMDWLLKLYETDAAGVIDEELIDKIGHRLYERCNDCILVTDAAMGRRYACPACRSEVDVSGNRDLTCRACGWASTWREFHASWRHKELAGTRDLHEEFIASWDRARSPKEKMLAIDRVIHRWHREQGDDDPRGIGRPLGVNLIEGSRKQVIAFLDRLSAGPNHDRWTEVHERVKKRQA
jgi:hypothetical protein